MLKKLLMAAAITLSFAGASSAATITLTDGQVVNPVNTQDVYLYEEVLGAQGAVGGAGSRTFTFTAAAADAPLSLGSLAAHGSLTGNISGAYLSWTSTAGTVFATPLLSIPQAFTATLDALFTAPDLLTQTVTIGWTGYTGPVQLSLGVAAVPLPAGGLLLFSALGGVAALRRRRKAA